MLYKGEALSQLTADAGASVQQTRERGFWCQISMALSPGFVPHRCVALAMLLNPSKPHVVLLAAPRTLWRCPLYHEFGADLSPLEGKLHKRRMHPVLAPPNRVPKTKRSACLQKSTWHELAMLALSQDSALSLRAL